MCNHELKRLFYTSNDDYDIQTCGIELEGKDGKYILSYCEKCGQVFVMEIAEKDKIRVGDEVTLFGRAKGLVYIVGEEMLEGVYSNCDKLIPFCWKKKDCRKTGRHFDEVEELVKKMGEE